MFNNGLFYYGKYYCNTKIDGKVYQLKNQKLVYEGGWGKDTYHGKGKLNRASGAVYEGDFHYGLL